MPDNPPDPTTLIRTNDQWHDIGHGVTIQIRYLPGETTPAGVAYRHPHRRPDYDGQTCPGWIHFHNGGWELVSVDPLTVTPSLECRVCGHHGHITDGAWVPA